MGIGEEAGPRQGGGSNQGQGREQNREPPVGVAQSEPAQPSLEKVILNVTFKISRG